MAITIQDSEGITSSNFDLEFLKNLKKWIIQMTIKKGKSRFSDLGYNPTKFNPKIDANSVYI